MLDKIPPHDIELEKHVLSGILFSQTIDDVSMLKTDSFYSEPHRDIFNALKQLSIDGLPLELMTISGILKKNKVLESSGGIYYLSKLMNETPSGPTHKRNALSLEQLAIRRRMIIDASNIIKEAYDETKDVFEVYESAQLKFTDVSFNEINFNEISPLERMKDTLKYIQEAQEKKGLTGVPTGLRTIDYMTGGWQKGNVIVIGGKPGTFKTALVLFFAHKSNKPVYVIQQEMLGFQTGMREIGMNTGIDTTKFRKGGLSSDEWSEINKAVGYIEKSKVYIEHENQTSLTVISKIKKMYKEYAIEMAIIDYFQLTDIKKNKGDTDEAAYANFMMQIKRTAKLLGIPIIVLTQYNRDSYNTKTRTLVKPNVGMIKGSGAIDATADVTILLWNITKDMHEMGYDSIDIENKMIDGTNEQAIGKLDVIFAKNRMGDLRDIFIGVDKATNNFYDLDFMLTSLGLSSQEVISSRSIAPNESFNMDLRIGKVDENSF